MTDPKCLNCGKSILECQGFCQKKNMQLSDFTEAAIEDIFHGLNEKLTNHNTGKSPLMPEEVQGCQRDIEILALLLSGKYQISYQAIINKDIRAMADIAEGAIKNKRVKR